MTRPHVNVPDSIQQWLTVAVQQEASDLHLVVGHPPVLRVHGTLQPLEEAILTRDQLDELLPAACPPPYSERFSHEKNTDFSLEVTIADQPQRFRANYFFAGTIWARVFVSFLRRYRISSGRTFRTSWPKS